MKKFKFKLEAVLKERKIREDERKREMAEILREYKKEETLLNEYYKYKERLAKEQGEVKVKEKFFIKDILESERFILSLRNLIKNQKQKMNSVMEKVKEKQLELAEAMKQKKIIDKIKEKQKKSYYLNIETIIQKDLDELSILRNRYV